MKSAYNPHFKQERYTVEQNIRELIAKKTLV